MGHGRVSSEWVMSRLISHPDLMVLANSEWGKRA